jgi:hypothetical protein
MWVLLVFVTVMEECGCCTQCCNCFTHDKQEASCMAAARPPLLLLVVFRVSRKLRQGAASVAVCAALAHAHRLGRRRCVLAHLSFAVYRRSMICSSAVVMGGSRHSLLHCAVLVGCF